MAKKSSKPAEIEINKIVDVANPNDTPSPETSKPVIISQRPLMRDPMMAAPVSDESPAPAEVKLPEPTETAPETVRHERIIMPPGQAKPATVASARSKMLTIDNIKPRSEKPAETVVDLVAEPAPKTVSKPEVKPQAQPAKPKPDTPLSPEAQEAQDDAEEDIREKELAKLVEDQTYFLPVGAVAHKKARRYTGLVVLLILVLGALWLNIALDADLIQIDGVEALTNFFKN